MWQRDMLRAILVIAVFTFAKGDVGLDLKSLQPVQGLYVKPSADGTTGDLYVAASEDNGVGSQWLTDQPVKILPVASQPQPAAMPAAMTVAYAPSLHEDPLKKRAVFSPPVKYAYAYPLNLPSPSDSKPMPYPYMYPPPSDVKPRCHENKPNVPYTPYHLVYPHMMSAYANAMSILKDAGLGEEAAGSVVPKPAPMWPPATFAYPMQYVMVDPSSWTQSQTTTVKPTTTTEVVASSEEDVLEL